MAGEKIGPAGSTCTPRRRPRPEALKAERRCHIKQVKGVFGSSAPIRLAAKSLK